MKTRIWTKELFREYQLLLEQESREIIRDITLGKKGDKPFTTVEDFFASKEIKDRFVWTDELVLIALDLAHHNGYHKFPQRCVDLFDEVKNQAMKGGYQYPKWVTEHLESKQPKKDWEILSLKDYKNEGEFYTELPSGLWSNSFINERYSLNKLLKLNYPIHSVRRLSDNEVFSIGDNCLQGKIEKFYLNSATNTIVVDFENGSLILNKIQKVKEPIPLFTTEDGKNIFTGDTYWSLVFNALGVSWNWIPVKCNADYTHEGMAAKKPPLGMKQFSTKEAAEEYILMNKPVLSLKEIMDVFEIANPGSHPPIFFNYVKNAITELVKSKLNG